MIGETQLRVRYAETDQMGRAHHAHYVVWCELARTNLMREHGVSYAELERRGTLLPVSRVEVEYRAPLEFDALVLVRTWVERVRSREVVFGYEIVDADRGRIAAVARIALVSVGVDRRPTRLPDETREQLVALARGAGGVGGGSAEPAR